MSICAVLPRENVLSKAGLTSLKGMSCFFLRASSSYVSPLSPSRRLTVGCLVVYLLVFFEAGSGWFVTFFSLRVCAVYLFVELMFRSLLDVCMSLGRCECEGEVCIYVYMDECVCVRICAYA